MSLAAVSLYSSVTWQAAPSTIPAVLGWTQQLALADTCFFFSVPTFSTLPASHDAWQGFTDFIESCSNTTGTNNTMPKYGPTVQTDACAGGKKHTHTQALSQLTQVICRVSRAMRRSLPSCASKFVAKGGVKTGDNLLILDENNYHKPVLLGVTVTHDSCPPTPKRFVL